jgi:hypothetical protein
VLGLRLNIDRMRSLLARKGSQRGHAQLGFRHSKSRALWRFERPPVLARGNRRGSGCSRVAISLQAFRGCGRVWCEIVSEMRGRSVWKRDRVMTGRVTNTAGGAVALRSAQARVALLESHEAGQAESRVGSHPPYDKFAPRAVPDVAELCTKASLRPIWAEKHDLISLQAMGRWRLSSRDIHVRCGRRAPGVIGRNVARGASQSSGVCVGATLHRGLSRQTNCR